MRLSKKGLDIIEFYYNNYKGDKSMFFELKIDEIVKPLDGAECIKDNKVLVWTKNKQFKPQYNKDKAITDFFATKNTYKEYEIKKIPVAYIFDHIDFYKDKLIER